MRLTARVILAGCLSLVVLAALYARPEIKVRFAGPPPAEAQGVGVYIRPLCTSITSPVQGSTFCFDGTENVLKVWNGSQWVRQGTDQVANVTDYGAVCNGTTDDTVAIRAAFNSGLPVVIFNNGPCVTQTITIPSTTRFIFGQPSSSGKRGIVQQKAQDADVFNGNDIASLTIANLDFLMVGADRTASLNNAIYFTSSTQTIGTVNRITIDNVYVKNSQHRGILIEYGRNVTISNSFCDTCSGGFMFSSVQDATMFNNTINASQLSATFSDGLSINTPTNTPSASQHNQRVRVIGNMIRDRNSDQSILVHDCQQCTIVGNVMTNAFEGIALQPAGGSTQIIGSTTVANNTFSGALTAPGGGGSTAYGIAVGGDTTTNRATAVTINGNVIYGANQIGTKPITGGGIYVSGATDRLSITGNTIGNVGAAAILVTGAVTNQHFVISGNSMGPITTSADGNNQAACVDIATSNHMGLVSGNYCDQSINGYRVENITGTNVHFLSNMCGSNLSGNCFPATGGSTGVALDSRAGGFLNLASSRLAVYNGNTPTNGRMLMGDGTSYQDVGGSGATLALQPTGTFGVQIGTPTGTDKGLGTINWASAAFANGLPYAVASPTGANLMSVRGISATQAVANNLRGTCTFAAASTCTVAFARNEPDASYFVALGGGAAAAANVMPYGVTSKAVSGFTITATVTNSNAVDWILIH